MGAQFWRSRSAILRFFVIFEKAKKTVFRQGRFFTFFHHFWCLLGGLLALFWRPFGVSVVSLACRCPPFGCLFTFFVFLGVTLKIAVLPAWELNSGDCWCLLGGLLALFWRPFGVSVVSLACRCPPFGCLWLVWAVRGPSMGSLCYFLWCLWLVRAVFGARGPLRDHFLLHFSIILGSFSKDSGGLILKPF